MSQITVTPLEALRRLYDVARKVDAKESGEFETLLQGELAVVEAVLHEPDRDEELAKVKSDVEGLMGYGFMVDNRRVGMDRIVWFNRPGEQRLHARPLPDNDEAIQDEFNEWIGPRRSGESPQEAAVLYWAQEAYRAGRLAAPVVPVAAQPVVPEGWRVVPIRPTHEMVRAACDAMGATQSVMLAIKKAPLPPFVGALKFDPVKLSQLIHDFGNASFEGGEWEEGDEGETIYQIHARCDTAKAALVQHICSLAAPQPAASVTDVAKDAARWQQMLRHVGADRSPAMGCQYFVFRGIHAEPGVDLMRGSVAGHFTEVIDAAIAAQQGEKT